MERFWSKVDIKGPSDCWEWKLAKNNGYGVFSRYEGKTAIAHRVAFILSKGHIPKGLQVMHKCDNRACCNPEHLILGTNKDNVEDMINKGRNNVGERNGNVKLKRIEVEEIRYSNKSVNELSEIYQVGKQTIRDIKNNRTWL